jgi:hypothetical protein
MEFNYLIYFYNVFINCSKINLSLINVYNNKTI